MITRVTSMTMMHAASRNLQHAGGELARLQSQASTQKNITAPSDDPGATADALKVRADQKANAQFTKNVQDATGWLSVVDSSLSSATELLRKAKDLTLQGSNASMSPTAKEAIAVELESIKKALLDTANTKYLGRSVFAGNSDAPLAYGADYAFTGGEGTVERRISGQTTVRVDADGAAIFGEGATSVFAELDAAVADLRSGAPMATHLTVLDAREKSILTNVAVTGARQSTIETAAGTLLDQKVELETQRSSIEDIDIASIILELKMQETIYQASLAVTARALQPTLMDFIR